MLCLTSVIAHFVSDLGPRWQQGPKSNLSQNEALGSNWDCAIGSGCSKINQDMTEKTFKSQ